MFALTSPLRLTSWRAALLLIAALSSGCAAAPPHAYHFSPSGNDETGDGSHGRPWQTISKANTLALHPDDCVLFEAGQTFIGSLELNQNDSGTGGHPVVIGSYGQGRASIDAGGDIGISVHNAGNLTVRDLIVIGAGRGRNWGAGVAFFNDLPDAAKLENIRIDNVDVSGFQFEGILLQGRASDGSRSGYRHVRIVHCKSHHNLHTGIYITGWWKPDATDYANDDVYVGYCEASENTGDPNAPWENRSGSGIFIEATSAATVEYCLASGNGRLCNGRTGGPVGIWASIARGVTFRCNKSADNHTCGRFDGGGFCLDGGVIGSLMQYNCSESNDGSGFGIFNFDGAPITAHNVVRDNTSTNDGRRNGYAGIHLWNGGQGVRDIEISHNTITIAGVARETPRGVWVQDGAADVSVHDNRIVTSGSGTRAVEVTAGQKGIRFAKNEYHDDGGTSVLWLGHRVATEATWERENAQKPAP